ncbi:MAG: polysaccharide deacetylase family protein [Blastocatellia bacterium]
MTTDFAQLRAALNYATAQHQIVDLFFRDDDVAEDEPALNRLLDVFIQRRTPVNLAVIPGRLTEAATAMLRQRLRTHAHLIEINQHGWMHLNHETAGRKCEFGPTRTFAEQFADIESGRRKLTEAFGADFSAVFVPPWNRCTEATLRAIDELEFQALSQLKGAQPVTGYGFTEISVTLDLHRWKGGVTMKDPAELDSELSAQVSAGETTGVMLHHQVMDDAAFAWLARLLDELSLHSCLRIHTFQSLLRLTSTCL